MADWSNRVAVITGAASGIGSGLAAACADRGMHVVAADVDVPSLERVASRIEAEKFWIFPQPGFKPIFEVRAKSVLEETNPPSTDEMLQFTTR